MRSHFPSSEQGEPDSATRIIGECLPFVVKVVSSVALFLSLILLSLLNLVYVVVNLYHVFLLL